MSAYYPLKRPIEEERKRHEIDEATLRDLKLGQISKFIHAMTALNPNWTEDTRLRLETESMLKQAMFGPNHSKPLSIGHVANEMHLNLSQNQLIKVGAAVARMYRSTHGKEPPKFIQASADGVERRINSYTEVSGSLSCVSIPVAHPHSTGRSGHHHHRAEGSGVGCGSA